MRYKEFLIIVILHIQKLLKANETYLINMAYERILCF